ncbi:MAG: hypothetical protein Q7U23_09145 [Methylococcales bacterium]|jgi:hypothetical protein|nr:hypothetical protein [Methylococcales bacterium]
MAKNTKETSTRVASHAAEILQDPNASKIQKSLAGSALSQSGSSKQTGAEMETKASKVLSSDKYSAETKELAASVLSQSNKSR